MSAITTIQFRRGTAAQWSAANPILSDGELGWESDNGEFKIGNGVTAWNSLGYWVSDVMTHTHTAAQISDASTVGRSVLTAASTTAARTAIGAGTSNLALGTTSSTAKAGNWVPAFSDISGIIGTDQLPPLAINQPNVVASQAAMLALTAERGDVAIRTDTGQTFILAADAPATLANWKEILASGQVVSVAGKTGSVTLVKADVGLSAVDNTSDASKPVSTATQTALNAKANLASPTFTGTVGGISKSMVGLSAVDNTSDANKPVSNAMQTALNGKAASSHTHNGTDINNIDGGTP